MTTRLYGQWVVWGALTMAAGPCMASPEEPIAPVHEHGAVLPAIQLPDLPAPEGAAPTDAGGESAAPTPERRAHIVMRALSLLGVSYRFGGNRPETGLDCSGLVRLVFRDVIGMALPRRSAEISRAGNDVTLKELRPGDLVFFNTLRRAFSHVGIYIGNDQFVHAPSTGGQVRVETINKRYWLARFDGARRLASLDAAELGRLRQPSGD